MKSNKDRLYYYLQENSDLQNDDFKGFTTQELATALNLQRTNLSALLNELVKENKVVKMNGRPVYYRLCTGSDNTDDNFNCFNRLIGYNTTLKNAIQFSTCRNSLSSEASFYADYRRKRNWGRGYCDNRYG